MRMRVGIGIGFCLWIWFGCTEPEQSYPSGPSYSVRDSAGIEIVENQFPAWSENEAWTVSRRPDVRIGERDGPEEYTFGNIAPHAIGRFADGRIFAGDNQALAVRVYSPEGFYLGSAGREGEGPGELTWFSTVSNYRGDSIWVYESHDRYAVSIFGPDLTFSRMFRNPIPDGSYSVRASLRDGRFLLNTGGGRFRPETVELVRDSSFVVVAAADGMSTDTIGDFEVRIRRGNGQGDIPDGHNREVYLFPQGVMTGRDDRVLWAEGRDFEYIEADPEGTIHRIVRWDHDLIPVSEKVKKEYQEAYLRLIGPNPSRGPFGPDWYRRRVEEGLYPEYLPATSYSLEIDPLGYVWFGRFSFVGAGVTVHEWEVFSPEGIWLGTVETPDGLAVGDIGVDRIIGMAKDQYDVQYVEVYELNRR